MQPSITPQMTVAELLSSWPETAPVFMKRRMSCVGCCMSAFDTLQEAALVYQFDLAAFLEEISRAVNLTPDSSVESGPA